MGVLCIVRRGLGILHVVWILWVLWEVGVCSGVRILRVEVFWRGVCHFLVVERSRIGRCGVVAVSVRIWVSRRVMGRMGMVRLLGMVRWMSGMLGVGVGVVARRNRTARSGSICGEVGVYRRRIEVRCEWWWEVIGVWDNSRGVFVVWGWETSMMNSSSGRIRIKAWLLGRILLLCAPALLPPLLCLELVRRRVLGKCGRIRRERFSPKIVAV